MWSICIVYMHNKNGISPLFQASAFLLYTKLMQCDMMVFLKFRSPIFWVGYANNDMQGWYHNGEFISMREYFTKLQSNWIFSTHLVLNCCCFGHHYFAIILKITWIVRIEQLTFFSPTNISLCRCKFHIERCNCYAIQWIFI